MEELFPLLLLYTFHFYQTSQHGKKNPIFKKLPVDYFFLQNQPYPIESEFWQQKYQNCCLLLNQTLCLRSVWLPQALPSDLSFNKPREFQPLNGAKCLKVGVCAFWGWWYIYCMIHFFYIMHIFYMYIQSVSSKCDTLILYIHVLYIFF